METTNSANFILPIIAALKIRLETHDEVTHVLALDLDNEYAMIMMLQYFRKTYPDYEVNISRSIERDELILHVRKTPDQEFKEVIHDMEKRLEKIGLAVHVEKMDNQGEGVIRKLLYYFNSPRLETWVLPDSETNEILLKVRKKSRGSTNFIVDTWEEK